ncbi:MAG: DNA polymerase III subunit gamma/tau [Alphaproteobacteria bacterium]|nr:DNA polymerase III subunit gamma/tau [Alphaproteobacteria bacterium]
MAKKGKSSDAEADEPALGLSGSAASASGAYRVLARKYRPQTFEDAFIGQAAMVRTLANAFAAGRIAHAFMLTGVRGVGKTTTARILAKALNCSGADGKRKEPTVSPCGACEPCKSIAESRNIDVYEMDAASNTGIDDIREIIEGVRYAPAQSRYKVYIIDEVHMLSKQAFNGLLKTLEEPPPHVKFVFATTEIRKVPITVLSRCQRFDLKRVPVDDLVAHLAAICKSEAQAASDAALRQIARAAEGSVRDALSLLDQAFAHAGGGVIEEEPVRVMLGLADRGRGLELFERLMRGAIAEALAEFRSQYDSGADPLAVMQDMTQICHEVTRVKVSGGTTHAGAPESEARRVGEMAAKLTVPQLARTWQLLLKALSEVQSAPDGAAAVEMAMIRIAFAAELPPTEQLLRTVGSPALAVGPRGVSSVSAPAAPPPMRMSATRNESVTAPAEPSAGLAPVVAMVPKLELRNFAGIVELTREKREARLVFALEHWVHLVAFERGRLELRLNPAAPATFPGELSDRLAKWTGERWIVSVSSAEGEATLADQAQAEEQVRHASAAQDPLLKAAMAMFPGARIVAVRDRDALVEPEGNGERE